MTGEKNDSVRLVHTYHIAVSCSRCPNCIIFKINTRRGVCLRRIKAHFDLFRIFFFLIKIKKFNFMGFGIVNCSCL